MNQVQAIEAFAALAHASRIEIVKLLVREEPKGLSVGEIARQLEIVPSTLSGHLSILRRAGLLRSVRHKREIIYSTDFDQISDMIGFLVEDCCKGHVDTCDELLDRIHQVRASA